MELVSNFLGMGKAAKARKTEKRAVRMERKKLRNENKKAKIEDRKSESQLKAAQANLLGTTASEGATGTGKKSLLIGVGILALILLLVGIFFLVKKSKS